MFPDIGPLIRALFVLSAIGLVAMLAGSIAVVLWAVDHLRIVVA